MLNNTFQNSLKIAMASMLLASLFLASCATRINSIYTNIEKYDGKEVSIKGKVENTTDILITKYYYLDDGSGKKMRVVTDNDLPNDGEKIKVTGVVNQRFSVGEFQWIVLKEKKH